MQIRTPLLAIATAIAPLTATGCAVTRGQETVGAYVDDAGITTLIKSRFVENKQVDAAAIMKLGTNFEKVRRVVTQLGHGDRALYIERATMANQRTLKLAEIDPKTVPYFSMILIPGRKWQG